MRDSIINQSSGSKWMFVKYHFDNMVSKGPALKSRDNFNLITFPETSLKDNAAILLDAHQRH